MVADNINHPNACLQMFTGEQVFSRPSLGSWLLYGLGSENQDLPGFVAICPSGGDAALWGSSFLPASYQGTRVADLTHPIANLGNGAIVERRAAAASSTWSTGSTGRHRRDREEDSRLDARIESFELAFRMQMQAPEAFDIGTEPESMRRLYGLDQPHTEALRQPMPDRPAAGRAGRAVRPAPHRVQLGPPYGDSHRRCPTCCAGIDRARRRALLKDLKARGLLDDTLVIWGGEFGRSPVAQKGDGRDHHPYGFTMWLAGGGDQGRHRPRRHRRVRLVRCPGQGPRPRPARHDPAPDGHRPRAPHLPIRRPRLPPHRCLTGRLSKRFFHDSSSTLARSIGADSAS